MDRVARSVLKPWNASGACSWVSMMIGKLMFIDPIEFDALCDTLRQNFLLGRIETKVLHTSIGKILSHFVAAFVSYAWICQ